MKARLFLAATITLAVLATSLVSPIKARAAAPTVASPSDFFLQVSPSPLVATVKPGQLTTLELKIRNGSTGPEELKIEPRGFTFDSTSGKISINDTSPADVASWISFGAPSFIIKPGEWYTQKVKIQVPKDAGFSYSFSLIVSRKNTPQPVSGGRLIKGSLAVFTLVNVDRPGSTRKLEIPAFVSTKHLYEYLPVKLSIQFKNSGNSIVQPYGNVFMQRGTKDESPLSTLPVNDKKAYILPGTTRTVDVEWASGFPVYKTVIASNGQQTQKLAWDWNHASDFRIGKYTAKLVAVYNDGARDIPIEQTVSFWVIPWRAILGFVFTVTILVVLGRWHAKRRIEKAVRKALATQDKPQKDKTAKQSGNQS